jgi:hypothetical protein
LRESHILLVFERSKVSSVRSQIELRNGILLQPAQELASEYEIAACNDELQFLVDELTPAQFAVLSLLVDARRMREARGRQQR